MDKLYAGIDMTIENGELNNVESMKSLSRFIELKDLENVKFATLKNQFEIKNQVITIPKDGSKIECNQHYCIGYTQFQE